MKTFKKIIAATACAFAFSASANAAVIDPLELTQDPENYQINAAAVNAANRFTTLTFDLNALLASYSATPANIISAFLEIYLLDPGRGNEAYTISVGGQTSNYQNINNGNQQAMHRIDFGGALADLTADGIISATITATSGELYFDRATLSVAVDVPDQEPGEVPEPASLAILGLGLLGLAAARRRAK